MNADDSAAIRRDGGRAPEKKTRRKKGKIKASKKANKVTDTERILGAWGEAGSSCLKHLGRRSSEGRNGTVGVASFQAMVGWKGTRIG